MIQSQWVRTSLNWNDAFTLEMVEEIEIRGVTDMCWRTGVYIDDDTVFLSKGFVARKVMNEGKSVFRIHESDTNWLPCMLNNGKIIYEIPLTWGDAKWSPNMDYTGTIPVTVGDFVTEVVSFYTEFIKKVSEMMELPSSDGLSLIYHSKKKDCMKEGGGVHSKNVRTGLNWDDPFTMGALEHIEIRSLGNRCWKKCWGDDGEPYGGLSVEWAISVDSKKEKPFRIYDFNHEHPFMQYRMNGFFIERCGGFYNGDKGVISLPKVDMSFKSPETVGDVVMYIESVYQQLIDKMCEAFGLSSSEGVSLLHYSEMEDINGDYIQGSRERLIQKS